MVVNVEAVHTMELMKQQILNNNDDFTFRIGGTQVNK
jgi:hypothetical protein